MEKQARTDKHDRVLAMAGGRVGCSQSIYLKEARELEACGMIESRPHFSKVGARSNRWFLVAAIQKAEG